MSTRTASFGPGTTLYGTCLISCVTSEYLRPMNRLIEKTVRSGFNAACRLAICPTRRSPVLVKATTDGVVRPPSLLTITVGLSPSIVATTELVVPRSIPTAFAILQLLSNFQNRKQKLANELSAFCNLVYLGRSVSTCNSLFTSKRPGTPFVMHVEINLQRTRIRRTAGVFEFGRISVDGAHIMPLAAVKGGITF